ncbi:hypothetical protein [Sphingobacterium siyangense]|uniref:hypothetical protein n=1 Tax=Sphingobacterium siyangense TaxID=459529 RepID=UPI003DA3D90F
MQNYQVNLKAGTQVVAEMVERVEASVIGASVEAEPLVGGNSLANAVPIPNGPANADRKWELSAGKWYKINGNAQQIAEGKRWVAWWDHVGSTVKLKEMATYPKGANGQGLLFSWDPNYTDPDTGLKGYKKDAQVRVDNVTYVSLKDSNTSSLNVVSDWMSTGVKLDSAGGALSYDTGSAILDDCIKSEQGYQKIDLSSKISQGGYDNGVANNRTDRIRCTDKINGNKVKLKVNSAYGIIVTWMSGNSFLSVTAWLKYTSLTELYNANADSFKLHFRKDNDSSILPNEFADLGLELYVFKAAEVDKAMPQGWKNISGGVLGYEFKGPIEESSAKNENYDGILQDLFDSNSTGFYSFDFTGKIVQGGVQTSGALDNTLQNRVRVNDLISGNKLKISINSPSQFWLTWYNSNREKISEGAGWLQPTSLTEYSNVNASYFILHFRKSINNENITPVDFATFGVQMQLWYVQRNKRAASVESVNQAYSHINEVKSINNFKTQISDGFLNAASAAHFSINKKGLGVVSYLGGIGSNFGESPGRIMLSVFPITQPTQAKHYLIKEGEMAFESNSMLLSDDVVRVNYFLKGYDFVNVKQNKFRDFNLATQTLGPEQQATITYNGTQYDLNNESVSTILGILGITANFNWGVIDVCRPILGDGYYYKALCSVSMPNFQPQPIVFVKSNDGFATMQFVGVLNVPCMYECQLEYDLSSSMWHILYRTNNGISYVNTTDFITFSSVQVVNKTVTSRPWILRYKGKFLILTNKTSNVTGSIGGELPINARSRIIGQLLNSDNVNNSEILFDISSRYGIVYPALASRHGELHMVFSDGSAEIEFSNNGGNQGKDSIFYFKIGELMGNIQGENIDL